MLTGRFVLKEYGDWYVRYYFAVDGYYVEELMWVLVQMGCRGEDLYRAWKNLSAGRLDTGLTYSNPDLRCTLMVVALTSSAAEFDDSYDHEKRHVCEHIEEALGIEHRSERAAYLAGDLARAMHGDARLLSCDCCRKGLEPPMERAGAGG